MKKKFSYPIRLFAIFMALLTVGLMVGCRRASDDGSEYVYSTIVNTISGNDATGNIDDSADTASAGNSGNQQSGTSNNGISQSNSDALKNVKTDGKTFTILSSFLPTKEEKDNTLFEKLFFERVREVEKKYGITIKIINTMDLNFENMSAYLASGKNVGNVMELSTFQYPAYVAAGYLTPWDNITGININDSKYTKGYTKVSTFAGKHYGLQFEKPPEVRYCMVMNKNLLKANGIDPDGIYNLVNKKQWNWDKLLEYSRATTNSQKGVTGIPANPGYLFTMLMSANNANIATLNSSGKLEPSYTSNNALEALNFLNRIVNDDKVLYTPQALFSKDTYRTITSGYTHIDKFIKGEAAFIFDDSWIIYKRLLTKENNYYYG